MQLFLTIQADYDSYEVGLCKDNSIIDFVRESKRYASRDLIVSLNDLLKKHSTSLSNISYIVVNQGPGPFTSSRVIITTVNGLNFASGIPLVGIDSLHALLAQNSSTHPLTVALLNGYNKDLYYAIEHNGKIIQESCKNYKVLFDSLKQQFPDQPIEFIGNGVLLHKDALEEIFKSCAILPDPLPEHASIAQFAKMGARAFADGKTSEQLSPIYLKPLSYKPII